MARMPNVQSKWATWVHKANVIPSSLLQDAPTNLSRNLPVSLFVSRFIVRGLTFERAAVIY